jgi:hypothetical protein
MPSPPSARASAPPDGHRGGPGDGEEPDDDVAEDLEVEPAEPGREPVPEMEPLGEDLQQLDRAHDERDEDRQRGDREVVVQLPHG